MIKENPLFTRESFKVATSRLGHDSRTLLYDGSDDGSNRVLQEEAGDRLRDCLWILAIIIDHIFDYNPGYYYVASDMKNVFDDFKDLFYDYPHEILDKAIDSVTNDFCALETITRDQYNQSRIPTRHPEEEAHTLHIFNEIRDNFQEILALLYSPKIETDPNKPSAREISDLIKTLKGFRASLWDNYSKSPEILQQILQTQGIIDMFLNPLYFAWQVYKYGDQSDFWEEGQSMISYDLFLTQVEDTVNQLITVLETQSPYEQLENDGVITQGLLKVYRNMLTQNWKERLF